MSTPAWIPDSVAAVTLLVAEVSAGQLVMARAWTGVSHADIAASRLLTGIAMAGVLVPGLSILPDAAWEAAFAVLTAWLAWRLWQESREHGTAAGRGYYTPPLVHSAAMLYMFAALTAPSAPGTPGTGGMSGMGGWSTSGWPALQAPALALLFTLLLIAFAVHDLDQRAGTGGYFQVAGPPGPAGPAARLLLSPAVVKGCQVATGVTLAFLLIILI
jgi:hypothetical protein